MIGNKKVLHVISSFGMGGAETWLIQILRFLNKNPKIDFPELEFLITSGKEGFFDEEAISLGAKLHFIKLDKNSTISFIKGFRKLLKEKNYVAIHNHQDYLSGWHFLFGYGLLPKVCITHVHNPSYQILENYGKTANRRMKIKIGKLLVSKFSTHIRGTSNQLLKECDLVESYNTKDSPKALHCSFDLNHYVNDKLKAKQEVFEEFDFKLSDKLILFVGRLDVSLLLNHTQNHKNSAFALHTFSEINEKGFKFLFVGANQYIHDEFMNLASELGINNDVSLLGFREDIPKLMASSDLLFFPSRAEGLGMVAVEAQASGLPVLVSDSVPKECLVIDELVNFYPLSNGPKKWAKKVIDIVNKEKPSISIDDARWINSDYNIEVSIDKMRDLYCT